MNNQNLTVKDVNLIIESLEIREREQGTKMVGVLISGLMSDDNDKELKAKIEKKLDALKADQARQKEDITIVKAKLYKLRDSINEDSIIRQVESIVNKPVPKKKGFFSRIMGLW